MTDRVDASDDRRWIVYRERYRLLVAAYVAVFAIVTSTGAFVFGRPALVSCLVAGVLGGLVQWKRRCNLVALARAKCEREVGSVSTVRANALGALLLIPAVNGVNVTCVYFLASGMGERRAFGAAVASIFAFMAGATAARYAVGAAAMADRRPEPEAAEQVGL